MEAGILDLDVTAALSLADTAVKDAAHRSMQRGISMSMRKLALAAVWSCLSMVLAWTLGAGTAHADALGLRFGNYDLTLNGCPTATLSCTGTLSIGSTGLSSLDITIGGTDFRIPQDYDMTPLFGAMGPWGDLFLDSSSIPSNGDEVLILFHADKQGHGQWSLGTLLACLPAECPPDVGPYGIEGVIFNPASGGWDIPFPAPEPTSLILLASGLAGAAAWARRKEKKRK